MCERLDEFGDADIAVVMFDGTARLPEYRSHHGIPERVRLLADPDRLAYEAFSLSRGSLWAVWGPKTWLAYLRLIRGGRKYQRHEGDTLQLGGDFVVGRSGIVTYAYRPPDPDARPSVDALLAALD